MTLMLSANQTHLLHELACFVASQFDAMLFCHNTTDGSGSC